MKKNQLIILIPLAIFLVAFGIRLYGLNAQGETWDEIAYFNAGKSYFRNIYHLDFQADHWNINKEHPPIGKYILGLASLKDYQDDITDFTAGRVASALMGALTVLIVYLIGKDLFSKKTGIISAIILMLLPYFIGFNKVYGLDTPTVLSFTLTIWLFLRAVKLNNNLYYLLSAISLGFALGIRLNNLLLYPLLFLIYLIFYGRDIFKNSQALWKILLFLSIPPLIFYLTWPWLWQDPAAHLKLTIGHWGEVKEIFLGQNIFAPYSYYFIYFLVTTPALILILMIPYLWKLFSEKNKYLWIIFVWFLIPFLWTFATIRQDGIRYILMLYPPLAIMAAYSVSLIKNRKILMICLTVLVSYLIFVDAKIHPYYIDYYNEFAGGPKKVYDNKWFQVGWWGEGLQEATSWLNDHAPKNAKIYYNVIPDHTAGVLRNDLLKTAENPDYIITNPNSRWYQNAQVADNYQLVYTVRADHAPLAQVYKKAR